MSRVDLDKNRSALLKAFQDVADPKKSTDWVLYGYDGPSNVLKVVETGDGGIEEMVDELNSGKVMYAYCQVKDPNTDLPKLVCINWQGEGVPENKKGVYANHITDVTRLFRGAHVTISARTEDDVDEDDIMKKVAKSSGANYSFHKEKPQPNANKPSGPVGSVYVKTRPHQEIKSDVREKFWEQQQAEEKQRQAYVRQKSVEEKQKLDKEIKERELREAQERDQRERARLQKIMEIKQAEKRANARNTEEEQKQWEKTQMESRQDEEERARRADQLRKDRASEAKSLVTGRQNNPRAMFDQKPRSQFDDQPEPERSAPPPRKLKHDFLEQKQEDTGRKQPIKLPTGDTSPREAPAASPPADAPPPAAPPAAAPPAAPPAAPAGQPHTRNLLAEGLPPRQDSDEEPEDQDWEAQKPPSAEPSGEDFSYPKQSEPEPEPEDTYDDVQHVQSYNQPADTQAEAPDDLYDDVAANAGGPPEDLYDDVATAGDDDVTGTAQGSGNYPPELGLVAKALYDYQAMEENEITFDPDDIITNVDQVDPGWWVGVAPDGKQGMFPSNYVELLNG